MSDSPTWTQKSIPSSVRHNGPIRSLAFSPNGRQIVSGGDDNRVRVWDIGTWNQIQMFEGHAAAVHAVASSSDGKSVASGSADSTVRLWSIESGAQLHLFDKHQGAVNSVAFNPSVPTQIEILTASDDGYLWEFTFPPSGSDTRLELLSPGDPIKVTAATYGPAGGLMAFGDSDGTLSISRGQPGTGPVIGGAHQGPVYALTFSPNGTQLISCGKDATISIMKATNGQRLEPSRGHNGPIYSVAHSPIEEIFASGGEDATIRIWSAKSGEHLQTLEGSHRAVYAISFAPDGKTFASGGADNQILLWSIEPDTVPIPVPNTTPSVATYAIYLETASVAETPPYPQMADSPTIGLEPNTQAVGSGTEADVTLSLQFSGGRSRAVTISGQSGRITNGASNIGSIAETHYTGEIYIPDRRPFQAGKRALIRPQFHFENDEESRGTLEGINITQNDTRTSPSWYIKSIRVENAPGAEGTNGPTAPVKLSAGMWLVGEQRTIYSNTDKWEYVNGIPHP